jgi:hypothetical protein
MGELLGQTEVALYGDHNCTEAPQLIGIRMPWVFLR